MYNYMYYKPQLSEYLQRYENYILRLLPLSLFFLHVKMSKKSRRLQGCIAGSRLIIRNSKNQINIISKNLFNEGGIGYRRLATIEQGRYEIRVIYHCRLWTIIGSRQLHTYSSRHIYINL